MAAALETGGEPYMLHDVQDLVAQFAAEVRAVGGTWFADRFDRHGYTVNALAMPTLSAKAQVMRFDMAGIAVSQGSACSSGTMKPSRVLEALGVPREEAERTIRMSLGWNTTRAEVERFCEVWLEMARDKRMIYLDYQATTPLAPEAREAMLRWLGGPGSDGFGNPSSAHRMGRMARAAVEVARDQVAALFPAGGRVIFTSGATEALNLAIRGSGNGGTVAFSAIEHSAVGDTAEAVGATHVIPVDADGIVDITEQLPDDTRLVAVMQVNNEIGTIQPVAEWGPRPRKRARCSSAMRCRPMGKCRSPTPT